MSRFADVMDYLDKNYMRLGISGAARTKFEEVVRATFARNNYPDDILSLNWNRFDKSRPDASERVEIRLALLAGICRKNMTLVEARKHVSDKKAGLRALSQTDLDEKTANLINKAVHQVRTVCEAARYTLQTKGNGTAYAVAHCAKLGQSVDEYIEENHPATLGIMLIDMQTADAGSKEVYGGKTVLEHETEVLKIAAEYKLHVFDIVIDAECCKGTKAQSVFNHPTLRAAWNGAQVHSITKPSHPSFIGTGLADSLKEHGVKELIVMGYHAGQCVKATIFGTPEHRMTVPRGDEENFARGYKAWGGYVENGTGVRPYVPGLLDRGYRVVTSRAILSSEGKLEADYGLLAGL